MQTLSDIPELVRCFKYNPPPKAQGKSASQVCHLVMELMEVGLRLSDINCPVHCMLHCLFTNQDKANHRIFTSLHISVQTYRGASSRQSRTVGIDRQECWKGMLLVH